MTKSSSLGEGKSTLMRVLGSLPEKNLAKMYEYSLTHGFHRGRQWFGTSMRVLPNEEGRFEGELTLAAQEADACPVGAAFGVKRDVSDAGWFSAKLDMNLLSAIKHIVSHAGRQEDGMEQYLKELENTDPIQLQRFIESRHIALNKKDS